MPKTTAPLIKGYLPIRLTFPTDDPENPDETFFYIKEHFGADKNTLFVANAPFYPGILTRILLRSVLGRYGEIERITVVGNPRKDKDTQETLLSWTTNKNLYPTFHGPDVCEGKFAHAVFSSQKEMKKVIQSLHEIMGDKEDDYPYPGVSMEKLEIQTLQDETLRKLHGEDDDDDDDKPHKEPLTGILAVADRYRTSLEAISREAILEECNTVMLEYEEAEEADRVSRSDANNAPDDDGFVTVNYSAQVGSKRELEEGVTTTNRRKGSKRSRTKKDVTGASELDDFYRFQQKDTRRRSVQELRKRFEEDLAKVKKMKEDRQYRPFS
jgi:ribosomal RNA-processing protein 7